MADFLAELLDSDPLTIILLGGVAITFLAVVAAAAQRTFMAIAVLILGTLVLILPNGTLVIAAVIILGVLYLVTKSGMGSKSVTIQLGDNNQGDVNIDIDF